MTREPTSSKKTAVVLSPDGEVEGHIVNDQGHEKISPEREIVYVPYESVHKSNAEKQSPATNYRSTIIFSNLLVAALVALYFHFAGAPPESPKAANAPSVASNESLASTAAVNKIDRSDQLDETQNPLDQPLEQIKIKASQIINDQGEDIGLVNSFLDSWREIAPSTKLNYKDSDWFQDFTLSLNEKISRIRNDSAYNESSQIYAGTLLNLSALLGIQTLNNQGRINTASNGENLQIDNNAATIVAGEKSDRVSDSDLSGDASSELANNLPLADSESTDAQSVVMDSTIEKQPKSGLNRDENNKQLTSNPEAITDIVADLTTQIAKAEADQKSQIKDESLHQADLVKGSHSVIGNSVKSENGYSESDLHYLLGQYATTYEFGDSTKLLALFEAKPEYRRALSRSFKKVFASSESRHIEFSELEWQFFKDSIIGNGKYKAKIELKDNKGTRYVNAEIQVKMLAEKDSLKIERMDFSNVKSKTIRPKTAKAEETQTPLIKASVVKSTEDSISENQAHATLGKPIESVVYKSNNRPKGPTAAELQDVITRFIGAYESGNIRALDNIFSLNARTNDRNNLSEIKSDYKAFFSNTTDRQLFIKDLKWTVNKELAKGIGNLNALVVKTDSDKINSINGEIEIVAQRIKDKVLITHLFHNYSLSKSK